MTDLRSVDLNLLVVFQQIMASRNLSETARQLDMSQPAVSHALRRLRERMNDELFVRTAQGMQPTPLAERLDAPVAEALSALHHVFAAQDDFDPATSARRFRLAMTDVGEIYFMPVLIEHCARHAPGVRLDTVRVAGADLAREMAAGRIDAAVGAFDRVGAGTFQRMLFRQGYATLFRRGHPTAHAEMGLKAFRAERHLIVSRAAPYGQVNQALARAGVGLEDYYSVPHFSAVPYILSVTDLLATVPEKLAASAAPRFDLLQLTPPVRVPQLQTNLYWPRRVQREPANQWLRDMVMDAFVALP